MAETNRGECLLPKKSTLKKSTLKKSTLKKSTYFLRRSQGLTLVEVMTVLVILSVLALFAAPDLITWRPRMNLKAAGEELFADMQRAKMHAIKNNVKVGLNFTVAAPCPGGSYTFDEIPPSGTPVAGGNMTEGVCLSASTFAAGEGFTSRGLPINGAGGNVTLTHGKVAGRTYRISQSIAGGVSLE
jgi:prepilin-type N-terminal cleavage/methylation domain-containing protein